MMISFLSLVCLSSNLSVCLPPWFSSVFFFLCLGEREGRWLARWEAASGMVVALSCFSLFSFF